MLSIVSQSLLQIIVLQVNTRYLINFSGSSAAFPVEFDVTDLEYYVPRLSTLSNWKLANPSKDIWICEQVV